MVHDTEAVASTIIANPLSGIGEAEALVLSYAALMGKEFDFLVLSTATEITEEPLAEILENLVHRGILKELKEGDSFAFVRMETFVQVYRDIASSRLTEIHKKIAKAYEKLYPEPPPDLVPEMGRHFHLGGVHEKALLYNRYAAKLAMNALSPDLAIRYLERALANLLALPGDHRVEDAEVLKEIGEQHSAMGEYIRADVLYGESLKKLPEWEVTLRALLLLSRADAARLLDRPRLARQYCDEAIWLLEKMGHKKGLALAHRILGRVAYNEGQFEVERREIEITLGFLDPEKDAKDVARCYIEYGNVHSMMPSPAEQAKAIEYYRKAIQSLEPLQDYHELARAHHNIAISMGVSAQPREALKELKEARNYAEKGKDKHWMGWALFNSVELHLALGEYLEAAQNNVEARRILSNLNDPMGLQQITLNDGILAQYRKSYEESERAYMEALRLAENLGYPPNKTEVLLHMAMMYSEWGRKNQAIRAISRIKEVGEDHVFSMSRAAYENLKKLLGV
jgi:tetratricopeptide (TPR) repeat protein